MNLELNDDEEIISLKINEDDDEENVDKNNELEVNEESNNILMKTQKNNDQQIDLDSQEMLSNMSENYETYSNDDVKEEEVVSEENSKKKIKMVANEGTDNREDKIDDYKKTLLKNKLPELQDLANTLRINIMKNVDGKDKKKTKLELANEIVQLKFNNNTEKKYLN